MPKELLEIKQFQTGTVSTPSVTDIPLDAASYSLNIDAISENGKLEGVPADKFLSMHSPFGWNDGTGSDETITFNKAALINDSGTDRLVTYNPDDSTIYKIDGFNDYPVSNDSRPSSLEAISSSADEVTMQKNNKEVHIGVGNTVTDLPKWCGMIPHSQFGTETTDLYLSNSKLESPNAFPVFYKVVADATNTYVYGVEWQGTHVYQFKQSDSTLVKTSRKQFTSIRGLALASDGNLWVVEGSGNTTVYKIDTDAMDIVEEHSITSGGMSSQSDIEQTGDYLWFAAYADFTAEGNTSNFLKMVNISSWSIGNEDIALIDKTWKTSHLGTGGDTEGQFVTSNSDSGTLTDVEMNMPKNCLVKIESGSSSSNDYIGIFGKIRIADGSPATLYYNRGGAGSRVLINNSSDNTYAIVVVKHDFTSGDYLATADGGKLFRTGGKNFEYPFCATSNHDVNEVFVTFSDNTAETTSTLATFPLPDFSDTNGTSLSPLDITGFVAIDFRCAVGYPVDDGGTVKYHIFSGKAPNNYFEDNGRWGYGAVSGLAKKLETALDIEVTHASLTGTFSTDKSYFYKASFVYDGYQESPLSSQYTRYVPSSDNRQASVTLSIRNIVLFNKRISHVNLYMSSGEDQNSISPTGFYRLVKSFELDTGWKLTDTDSSNPDWGDHRSITFTDDGTVTTSYEALNGISETLDNTQPHYALSTQLNNTHFIGNCYHSTISDASTIIFKSKPYNFDQFDWSLDLLRLPTVPTALASFNGRVYAFEENNTYRIEPNNFYIEDTFEGVGCHGANAVIVTEYGMFFADKRNIYMHNGKTPIPIGTSIMRDASGSLGWDSNTLGSDTRIIFDSERNSVMVSFKGSGNNYYFWSYNIIFKRWDLIEADAIYSVVGHFVGRDGSMYICKDDKIFNFMGASLKRPWNWTSKQITAGQDTQVKKFKKFRIEGNPSGTIGTEVFCTVGGSDVTETGTTSEWTVDNPSGKKCQINLINQTSDVDAIGIIYRRRPVR